MPTCISGMMDSFNARLRMLESKESMHNGSLLYELLWGLNEGDINGGRLLNQMESSQVGNLILSYNN